MNTSVDSSPKPLKDSFKDFVINVITERTFVKATVLPTLIGDFFAAGLTSAQYSGYISELVLSKAIVEIEYTVSDMPYRIKVLYTVPNVSFRIPLNESN